LSLRPRGQGPGRNSRRANGATMHKGGERGRGNALPLLSPLFLIDARGRPPTLSTRRQNRKALLSALTLSLFSSDLVFERVERGVVPPSTARATNWRWRRTRRSQRFVSDLIGRVFFVLTVELEQALAALDVGDRDGGLLPPEGLDALLIDFEGLSDERGERRESDTRVRRGRREEGR
jgi:hypothetical protein